MEFRETHSFFQRMPKRDFTRSMMMLWILGILFNQLRMLYSQRWARNQTPLPPHLTRSQPRPTNKQIDNVWGHNQLDYSTYGEVPNKNYEQNIEYANNWIHSCQNYFSAIPQPLYWTVMNEWQRFSLRYDSQDHAKKAWDSCSTIRTARDRNFCSIVNNMAVHGRTRSREWDIARLTAWVALPDCCVNRIWKSISKASSQY